jgi:hypothetical protein
LKSLLDPSASPINNGVDEQPLDEAAHNRSLYIRRILRITRKPQVKANKLGHPIARETSAAGQRVVLFFFDKSACVDQRGPNVLFTHAVLLHDLANGHATRQTIEDSSDGDTGSSNDRLPMMDCGVNDDSVVHTENSLCQCVPPAGILQLMHRLVFGSAHQDATLRRALAAYEAQCYVEARELLTPLAESGDPGAQCALASIYHLGLGVVADGVEAVRWYKRAADQGSALACNNLWCIYTMGWAGIAEDKEEARRWYEEAKRRGFAHLPREFS